MKLFKVVTITLILAAVSLLAFGCAESFHYTYYIDDVGAVHCEYLLVYDKDGEDASVVKEQAISAMSAGWSPA